MKSCPHCGKSLEAVQDAAFCPFCGGSAAAEPAAPEPRDVQDLLKKLEEVADPRKKHQQLLAAEERFPNSLAIAEALLFLGRLYERGGKNVDFSVIKCYLWMIFLKPEEIPAQRLDALRQEFFNHPQLEKCLSLCPDQGAFLKQYLLRLAKEFITLFLRGDSRYMRRFFGFGLDNQAPKYLAAPVAKMMHAIRKEETLTSEQRDLLSKALYQAFSDDMRGATSHLDTKLQESGITP